MLPDFLNLKRKLQKLLIYRMKGIQSASMVPFYDAPKRFFEGNRVIVVREDGSNEELKIKEVKAKIGRVLGSIGVRTRQLYFYQYVRD